MYHVGKWLPWLQVSELATEHFGLGGTLLPELRDQNTLPRSYARSQVPQMVLLFPYRSYGPAMPKV